MTYVCLVISPINWEATNASANSTGLFKRIVGNFQADSLSRFSVQNSWTSSNYSLDNVMTTLQIPPADNSSASALTISVQSQGFMSYQKIFRQQNLSASGGVTFPLLMAIIYVDKGVVTVHSPFLPFSLFLVLLRVLILCSGD